ncbi:MAG: ChaN family lipoprotein [Pseudomonadota bacterium]
MQLIAAVFALICGLTACASKPEAPIIAPLSGALAAETATRLDALLPADVLLLGEQHDAAAHQQIEQQVIANLAARGVLAAVVLEMADAGATTAKLHPSSNDESARFALKWNDTGWPWPAYGPAVMTAIRAGVPVMGGNLPRAQMKTSMADSKLDVQLPGPALKAQQQLIRLSHCNLLPESQITPMTRIQIAKDISMAETLAQAAVPGKVVVLLSGSGHTNRKLGVPQHLPATLKIKAVRLLAGKDVGTDPAEAFDTVWNTPALPEKDYCAGLKEKFDDKSGMGG